MLMDIRAADRGKRRGFGHRGGNVIYCDPRKKSTRFGALSDAVSSYDVTQSEKLRIRNHLVTAVQRHVVQKATLGESPKLSNLGGLTLAPPRPRGVLPEGSISSSQCLGSYQTGRSCNRPPSDNSRSSLGNRHGQEWNFVTKRIQKEEEGSTTSKVHSILSRCKDLRKEITSERNAASEANAAISRHAHEIGILNSDEEVFNTLQGLAKKDPSTKQKIEKVYRDYSKSNMKPPRPPCAAQGDSNPEICPNPTLPGLQPTRRHFKKQYQTDLQSLMKDE